MSPADIPLPDSPLTTPPASPKSRTAEIMPASRPTRTAAAHPPGYYARKSFPAARANTMWEVELTDDEEFSLDADAMDAVEHAIASIESDEPSVDEALRGPNADKWHTAMDEEVATIERMGTWELVDCPPGANVIDSHFILKVKRDENGNISRYKARLVANGRRQREGIDFNETFAAIAKLPSVRAVLVNAASQGWEIHQIDIKNAYLNAELTETVYMRPPTGYLKPGQEGKVCKLLKCLYGTKQAGFEWYQTLCEFFGEIRFTCSSVDHAVFFKLGTELSSVISVSTDDMAVTGNTIEAIHWVKERFKERFEVSDLGEIKWLLGHEVKYNKTARTLSISQRMYIDSLVERFELSNANSISMPMEPGTILSTDQSPSTPRLVAEMQNIPYKEIVGSFAWAALGSRPDISFPTSVLSQFLQNLGRTHWEAAKRVIRYLKRTREYVLQLTDPKEGITAYVDADWGSQPHCHSISGHIVSLGGMPIAWGSRKQNIVALSSTEAEYVAMTNALKDIMWLFNLLSEIRAPVTIPTPLMCDNQGAITLTMNNKFHPRTKHIDIRYHFIRLAVDEDKVIPIYCPTDSMVANMFMKLLARPKLQKFVEMIGLI